MIAVENGPGGAREGTLRELGYLWCRPCAEHHRPPECAIDQLGVPELDWNDDGDRTVQPCARCGDRLVLQPCGCWTGTTGSRWCEARVLHQPAGYRQPGRCAGAPAG